MARRRTAKYAAQAIPKGNDEITKKLRPGYTRPWATMASATLVNPAMLAPST